ncbi:hypothetical protein P152DRAFT_287820 [Eremomyces bilateralis CBS 781.70]|uniref:Uncharacterized protein n=1 Tax=Eremomyces bilateralis CBS 781.70 TaxID=1392243 RepID=A0A6G1G6L0_9PEZI|nr:uncharacterized protein P152DRAFT_287820 [Eremomyces bilateralis CBS 781.70]KAF1813664.1 hypothetical protein P152DRAFT_287820 [Eremomyces bilateralis CBS 781.70]
MMEPIPNISTPNHPCPRNPRVQSVSSRRPVAPFPLRGRETANPPINAHPHPPSSNVAPPLYPALILRFHALSLTRSVIL